MKYIRKQFPVIRESKILNLSYRDGAYEAVEPGFAGELSVELFACHKSIPKRTIRISG